MIMLLAMFRKRNIANKKEAKYRHKLAKKKLKLEKKKGRYDRTTD